MNEDLDFTDEDFADGDFEETEDAEEKEHHCCYGTACMQCLGLSWNDFL